eukprot:295555-Amphidinium_carterae.2
MSQDSACPRPVVWPTTCGTDKGWQTRMSAGFDYKRYPNPLPRFCQSLGTSTYRLAVLRIILEVSG